MTIQGANAAGYPGNVNSSTPSSSSASASANSPDATQTFLNYMKETPAQRMEDAWLSAHDLTQKDLAAMSPAKREAIMKEMAQDIKNKLTPKTQATS